MMDAQTAFFDKHGVVNAGMVVNAQDRVLETALVLGLPGAFRTWLLANWAIWIEFQKLADQMRLRGRQYYSARAVIHVLRWHRHLKDASCEDFKVNNIWSANMARLYNGIVGFDFFRTRESHSITARQAGRIDGGWDG